MPKGMISVVMSVYNGEEHLREAINSIRSQSYSNFEFLIVNDASTDSTVSILKKISLTDPRITVITNSTVQGLTKSLNRAIALSHGEYIARIDADDIAMHDRFIKQLDFLNEKPQRGAVGCWYYVINGADKIIRDVRPPTDFYKIKKALMTSAPIAHPASMIRRSVFEVVGGYDEEFRYAQDRDLFLRIAQHFEMVVVPDFLMKIRHCPGAISVKKEIEQKHYRIMAMKKAIAFGGYSRFYYALVLLQLISLHLPAPLRKIKNEMMRLLGFRHTIVN